MPIAHNDTPPSLGLWVLLLGVSGFCAGFFGPIALNPDANQGPLVGIFISGPGGALVGLILGIIFRFLPLGAVSCWRSLKIICAGFVLVTLYFCLPEPQLRGEIIEARAVQCIPPQQLFADGVARWEHSIAAAPWAKVPTDWKIRAQQAFRDDDGVVLEMAVARRAQIYEQRRPWNRGKINVSPLQTITLTKNYFTRDQRSDCALYLQRPLAMYYPQAERSADNNWPPLTVPNFLDLLVLTSVPEQYLPPN